MPDIACLNGTFSFLEEARVPVNDRGFLFGDGVYEVIRTYGTRVFRLDAHLERLERSLREVRITVPWNREQMGDWIHQGIARAAYRDSKIYIQVTRGVAPREHAFPKVPPTTLVTVSDIHPLPESLRSDGVAVRSTPDIRWGRCDIKSLNLLPNILARQEALDNGCFEALFVADGGEVREGAGSNLFAVIDGRVVTPQLGTHLLAGVSRACLLEVAGSLNLPVVERPVTMAELLAADEVFLSGTTIEVVPVTRIDGHPVGDGKPGPVTIRLMGAFPPPN
ncbi:MAG: D-amino acid aminotransferase [Nitrospirota bacterium]|nr:D-amino acid aminotransferase [Nitrospirota bacterium]